MEKKAHYHGHRQRLRERLLAEPKSLPDYEALELVLAYGLPRRDTKPLAKEMLDRFGSLKGVLEATTEELEDCKGAGPGVAAYFAALREFFTRLSEAPVRERRVMSSPKLVAEAAKARIGGNRAEEMWVVLVDNKIRAMRWERISKGTVDQAAVYPREVLALALRHQALGIILVHNHPGGDPKPSANDVELTRRISRAGSELGVRVFDHVVVTDSEYFSFQERGYL